MKQKFLLLSGTLLLITLTHAQQKSKSSSGTAYAITATEKGQNNWCEVRLMNVNSGEVIKTIYKKGDNVQLLNARTGKPVENAKMNVASKRSINLDQALENQERLSGKMITLNYPTTDKTEPFATNSAACAYDQKHERLYYTPMGVNQLRYIDLKSSTPRIYYFENENFGVVQGLQDVANQVPRLVIAGNGTGYGLSNNGEHLLSFTTGKKPVISDLGPVTDDPANTISIKTTVAFGGDLIADAAGNLYLVSASHAVFKINIESRLASFKGMIQGLPRGYSTNGAVAEGGSKVVVNSANMTMGFYRFDLETLIAEKIAGNNSIFNASDLANAILAYNDKKDPPPPPVNNPVVEVANKPAPAVNASLGRIAVYPNPVTNGAVTVSFENMQAGKYQVEFMAISGQRVTSTSVVVENGMQVMRLTLPPALAAGSYMLQVSDAAGKMVNTQKIMVQ
jgi:hypothetical protein